VRIQRLVILYMAFAAISIAVNIGAQAAAIYVYTGPFSIAISMLIGTAVGLVTKYVLDKKFIFLYASESANQEARIFLLYSVMGLATTAVFWATEYAFELAFDSDSMRYVGGVIGLIAGYIIKYHLDKRLVFK